MLPAANAPLFHLPSFEGPLDLLLHLIRKHQIDIYDIPIALITEQYLEYLTQWEQLDLHIAGEYLVIAATLIEIKARMLLPQPPPPEGEDEPEDPRSELVTRLLEYERYQGAVETLRGWEEDRQLLFFRGASENPDDYLLPTPEGAMQPKRLLSALRRLLAAAGVEPSAVTAVVPRRQVSVRMKMAEILRRVRAHPEGLRFDGLFELPCYRIEIVITFLAMLELLRQGQLTVKQAAVDADIVIYPTTAVAA